MMVCGPGAPRFGVVAWLISKSMLAEPRLLVRSHDRYTKLWLLVPLSEASWKRVRLLLLGGIDPLTTETAGLSSLVPWPNELSPVPLGRSKPGFRPVTFCQSVVPNVVGLVSRFPSPPANVLPASGDEHDSVV